MSDSPPHSSPSFEPVKDEQTAADGTVRLGRLLSALYSQDELRQFVRSLKDGKWLTGRITWSLSAAEVADEIARLLVGQELLGPALTRMAIDRPTRAREIESEAQAWGVNLVEDADDAYVALHSWIVSAFAVDELRRLASDLGFADAIAWGGSRSAVARNVVEHSDNTGTIPQLLAELATARPNRRDELVSVASRWGVKLIISEAGTVEAVSADAVQPDEDISTDDGPQAVRPNGEAIAALRSAQGLSQRALADRAGLSSATISRIEKGGERVRPSTLSHIASALSVPIDEVVRRDDPEASSSDRSFESDDPAEDEPPLAPAPKSASRILTVAPFSNDATEALGAPVVDALDLEDDAELFAQLLVSRPLDPPMAVGIFGDWGSGKTWFMNAVERSIRSDICDQIEADDERFHKHIAQIRFNAWHYIDSNLWVSLTTRIFDGLTEYFVPEGQVSERVKNRQRVRREIQSTRQRREETQLEIKAAEDRVATTKAKLLEAEISRNEKRERLTVLFQRRFWEELANDGLIRTQIDGANAFMRYTDLGRALENIDTRTNEAKELAQELRGFWWRLEALRRGLAAWSVGAWTTAVCLVAAPYVIWLLLLWLANLQVTHLWGLVASALGALATALPWALSVLRKASDWVAVIEAAYNRTNAIQEKLNKEDEVVRQQLNEAETELVRREAELGTLKEEIGRLEQELVDLDAGRLTYDFLEQRKASSDYRALEGIVSVVRRDLESLSQLLKEWRSDDGNTETENTPSKPAPERIILYIDDLDRCPPERVVEVLQAIHLLLAFDLFVVIVGVDARWLRQSLQEQYSAAFKASKDWQSDPDSYLEKIFQIPFILPSMKNSGYRNLVRNLLAPAGRGSEEMDRSRTNARPAAVAPISNDAHRRTEPLPRRPSETQRPGASDRRPPELKSAKHFRVEDHELVFMSALGGLVRTPRMVKRLVNLYRFIRVSVPEADWPAFIDSSREGHFRVVQLLLAISVGQQQKSDPLFRQIMATGDQAFWKDVLDDLPASEDQKNDTAAIVALRPVVMALITELPSSIGPFKRWTPSVARFSTFWRFHSNPGGDETERTRGPGAA